MIAQTEAAPKPWAGFKYEPVRGLSDRRIARFLRTQRKNMRRFFAERGLFDELEQMERIRKSRQGMMAKNRMFQEVLDAYAERVNPKSNASGAESGAAAQPATETEYSKDERGESMDLQSDSVLSGVREGDSGSRADTGRSVPEMARSDDIEPVIEE